MELSGKTKKPKRLSIRIEWPVKILVMGLLCLNFLTAGAQNSMELSLDNALQFSVEHNRTLTNSRYAVSKSSKKIRETIAAGLPQVSATLDYNNFLGAEASLQINPMAPAAIIEFNPTSSAKANISQLIFNANYIVGIQLSKLAKEAMEQSYQKDELNVREQVIQAYCLVLATERIESIIQKNKENAQVMQEKTQNLANAGILEQTNAKKLSVMVASVDNALKSAERQTEMGYNLLRLHLGMEPDQALVLTSDLDEIFNRFVLQNAEADQFDIRNNLDYKMTMLQGDMAKKNINLKKSNYLPSLVMFYSRTEKLIEPLFDMTPKNVLGLTLSVPIYSGGQRSAQLGQARIDYEISNTTREQVHQQLTLQERQVRFNYNTLMEQYKTQKENVMVSMEVLESMKQKYQQGIISSLELSSSNSDYLTAESNYTSTILQLINARIALQKINNKL